MALTKLTHTDGKQAGLGQQLGWVGGLGKAGLVSFFGDKLTVLASVSFTCTISINRGDLGTERETDAGSCLK